MDYDHGHIYVDRLGGYKRTSQLGRMLLITDARFTPLRRRDRDVDSLSEETHQMLLPPVSTATLVISMQVVHGLCSN